MSKPIQFTAVFRKVPEGYIGFVEELPAQIPRARRWTRRDGIWKKPSHWSSKLIEPWPKRIWSAKKSFASRSPLPHVNGAI